MLKCLSCDHVFVHTAKTVFNGVHLEYKKPEDNNECNMIHNFCDVIERPCCPRCGSIYYQTHVDHSAKITVVTGNVSRQCANTLCSYHSLSNEQKIKRFIAICKLEKRALTDTETTDATRLNWKLTCLDKTCKYYKNGAAYNAPTLDTEGDPCVECQTDFEDLKKHSCPYCDAKLEPEKDFAFIKNKGFIEGYTWTYAVCSACGEKYELYISVDVGFSTSKASPEDTEQNKEEDEKKEEA
ncbi:MAG: hypothetical protein LBE70_03065 [Nitrososphaerota archaeon]|jgi:uncharacterized C2H2 Zn-finger protein|nr:hypothetical protein [Nitrososphaerota archaeon]